MGVLRIYVCEICGIERRGSDRWFLLRGTENDLTVFPWSDELAYKTEMLHVCGEAHLQQLVARWINTAWSMPSKGKAHA